MNICSVCGLCFDDPVTNCTAEDHGILTKSRCGDRLSVKGYKINSEIKSDFPFRFYKAVHLSSEKSVLIKFVKLDSPGQFENELQADLKKVSQINHPNLARIFEYGKIADDEIYIVSEDISGQSLREYLEVKSPLLERHAIKIARQIAEGLEVLHENNVIHRAVNPSNIYFTNAEDAEFSVKLQNYDFGGIEQKIVVEGANGIDEKTEIYRYFSPEQFTSETIDFKSDLYSLAAVFYEMLLGRSPYDFLSPQAISNYVFDENDVEKLHFDLRALLAYTLKQSFQHRLNLRPPTTNNLARQFRHLELIATPPTIGLQEKQAKRNKAKQNVTVSEPKTFVAEEKIATPEIIENEIPTEENIALKPEFIEEIPAQENAVPMPEFTGGISVTENNPFETFVENKFESSEFSKTSIETKTEIVSEEIAQVEEPEIYIARETTKLEKQFSDKAAINFNTTDLVEFEKAFDNIHITNRTDEEFESLSSEEFEYEEPEFVDEYPKAKSGNERQTADSYISYVVPRSSSFNKNYVYIAAAIVLFIFGGLIAAGFRQSRSGQNSVKTAPQKEKKALSAEKKEPIAEPEKIKETAEITDETAPLPQFDGQQTNEISNVEAVAVKPNSSKLAQSEPAVKIENKTAPIVKEKSVETQNMVKAVKTEPVKKQEKTRTVNIDEIRTTKVIVVGKTKPPVKKEDTTSRPRVVTTSPSGN